MESELEDLEISLGLSPESKELKIGDVRKLERSLRSDPDHKLNRLRLIGYYQRRSARNPPRSRSYFNHILWMIDHYPDSLVLEHVIYMDPSPEFKIAKRRWNQAIKKAPSNLTIVWNAGHFTRFADPLASRKYYLLGLKLDPKNEDWCYSLCTNYLHAAYTPSSRTNSSRVQIAMGYARQALALHKKFPANTYLETYFSSEVMQFASTALFFSFIDDAQHFGECLLASRKQDKIRTDSLGVKSVEQPSVPRVHWSYSILGRVAIRRNKIGLAKTYLKLMETYDSRGWHRDLLLAQALLDAGEAQQVIEYLENCIVEIGQDARRFITSDDSHLRDIFEKMRVSNDPDKTLEEFIGARGEKQIRTIQSWINKIKIGNASTLKMGPCI